MTESNIDIGYVVRNVDIVSVVRGHVELNRKGSEHVGLCPFHNDTNPSLMVSRKKQVFLCPACGKAGNAYTFLRELGHTHQESMRELTGDKIYMRIPAKVNYEKTEYKPVVPIPRGLTPDPHHFELGAPSTTWKYRTDKGGIACYVHRYDLARGKKEIRYQTYDGNMFRWKCIPKERPLYNLHQFDEFDTLAIVEGEKAADAGNKHLQGGRILFTTWMGGGNAIKKADFGPTRGKNIILMPDNDVPGTQAMENASKIIDCHEMFILPPPKGLPKAWDIADKEWKRGELYRFIKKNVIKIQDYGKKNATI